MTSLTKDSYLKGPDQGNLRDLRKVSFFSYILPMKSMVFLVIVVESKAISASSTIHGKTQAHALKVQL